ncbi:short-chain dehydrogenase/reductase SDR [Capsaspora owczarzaki ATCC 30864]|uniref:Short-chain dehydrogenase/reductase 3 n=1 Tax=Capsaspora owczarzaki (strain ATCC 30864) TaxID=595528 RepID=A0A0D2VYR9_CAPO3|nr:short-chain dehydrogenase/reductase SDR [Capsaspora owczarzaki ATCC 30864]KJE96892.1 short-chain dehydrogenase/reductase SDR [Capsaspora owczarzaki ATCC 30864]|eukprot:XP_004343868.1 short-chain dehydrogenase/reductase SDR [Capsaspora owczarzaki ATCC 30864]
MLLTFAVATAFAAILVAVFLPQLLSPRRRLSSLADQVAVVSGGAQGLGREIVLRLAAAGCSVVVWDVDRAGLESLRTQVEASGGRIATDVVDVSQSADTKLAAERALQTWKKVTILINNAGVVSAKPLLELTDAQIQRTMGVNLLACFWTTRALLPTMKEQPHAQIVNIASVLGHIGVARLSDYCASKHGVVGFHESLCMELADQPNVVPTVVCPGTISTRMFDGIKHPFFMPPLTPEYVADCVVDRIHQGGGGMLVLPRLFHLMPFYRLLPMSLKVLAARLTGVLHSVDNVKGSS